MSSLRAGKLPPELLERLLDRIDIRDPRVLQGPSVGEDAALIDYDDAVLVVKSDPITFATELIGWYAVQVNANDVACMGAKPRWFVATLLLPEGIEPSQVESIFDQMLSACSALNIALIGGHTEVSYGLPRPIIVGAMLGEVTKGKEVRNSNVQVGDGLILTKGIAIEGTALLAREVSEQLVHFGMSDQSINAAQQLLFYPGISVIKDASIACNVMQPHALHDPTEGGLASGIRELAMASDVGIIVHEEQIRIFPETAQLCEVLKLDPLGLLASGALLIAVAEKDTPSLIDALHENSIEAYPIGKAVTKEEGISLITRAGQRKPLPQFERDELARFLAS
jgi:hydrogenase maturation factor